MSIPMKFTIALVSALPCAVLCLGLDAPDRGGSAVRPAAVATNADITYCYARLRGLDPGRLPQSYLVAQVRVLIAYRNAGNRAIILPLERERTVYEGLEQDQMNIFKERLGLFEPAVKVMKRLPPDVGPDNPISPKNEVFTVIPPGGEMTPPLLEEITLPVTREGFFHRYPDLRGHKVYLKLRFVHRDLSTALKTDLSDRWAAFGVPWTGSLTTNTFVFEVPEAPQAAPCVDAPAPAHPVEVSDRPK
jgi:hypothetical protein